MLFHRKQKHVNDVNIKIDNTMIEHAQTFNFLGIMLNETLSWKSHIDMVSNKIFKVIGILYRLNPIRSGLFQTVNDPGGGGFKSPPLRSRKLLCQSSPYHTCEFYQVFLA